MRVVVLVPRRSDGGRRDRVWRWLKARWETEHPDWAVYEGHHENGPFNRAAAINRAAWHATTDGHWDVAYIADSDSFVSATQARQAADGAHETGQMWLAFDQFRYLTHAMSDLVMDDYRGDWYAGIEWSMPGTCSSQVVVRRDVWDQAGGFDEGFEGWGLEDVAASHAFQTFGGGLRRAPGDCWHLWHAPAMTDRENSPTWPTKVARAERYHEAAYDKPKMRALLAELGARP